jgi:SAM-dependent methyltransferase
MPLPKDVYANCDVLDSIPKPNAENWLKEIELLAAELPRNASVLQVGSGNGARALRLLEARPDLKLTGLEIDADLVDVAEQKVKEKNVGINFVQGNIVSPPSLSHFDYVICLNNTLGYIPKQRKAVENMKKLGNIVIISVYGEKFDDDLARKYFRSINLEIDHMEGNQFIMKNFSSVKRYSKGEIASWGGKVTETPIGYFCVLG